MGVIDNWIRNVFELQMNKMNKQARVCVNSAISGPEQVIDSINSVKQFYPVFIILVTGSLISSVIVFLEYTIYHKLLIKNLIHSCFVKHQSNSVDSES